MRRLIHIIMMAAVAAVMACGCTQAESKEAGKADVFANGAAADDSEAILEGYYVNSSANGTVVEKGFVWGTSEKDMDYSGQSTETHSTEIAGETVTVFDMDVAGLKADTKYFYQPYVVVKKNNIPSYSYGDVDMFVTDKAGTGTSTDPEGPTDGPNPDTPSDPADPTATVTTGSYSGVTTTTATISGTFANATISPREVGFEWGTNSSKLDKVQQVNGSFSGTSGSFSAELSNLSDGTTYYYRAYVLLFANNKATYVYGSVKSFATNKVSTSTTAPSGFFELPAYADANHDGKDDKDSNLYYSYHSFEMSGKEYRNYTLCYSGKHHCPEWVAAPRHAVYSTKAQDRTDKYARDPNVPSSIQYSSKSTGGNCNKGHMLGSAERTCSYDANIQVFYYTNIAPQLSSGFNTGGGGWNTLEDWVDKQVCADTLYEVVGCHFDTFTDGYGNTVSPKTISFGGRNDVDMPTMFYYVLLRTKSGSSGKPVNTCSANELKCAAFVRSHTNNLKGQKVSSKEMMSVADLEKITGVTYFPNVPNAPKSTVNASDWGL